MNAQLASVHLCRVRGFDEREHVSAVRKLVIVR